MNRTRYSDEEKKIIRREYPDGGAPAVQREFARLGMRYRSGQSIHNEARRKLKVHRVRGRGSNQPVRAIEMPGPVLLAALAERERANRKHAKTKNRGNAYESTERWTVPEVRVGLTDRGRMGDT